MSNYAQLPKSHRSLAGNADPIGFDPKGVTAWLKAQRKGKPGWRSKSLKPRKFI